MRTRPVDLGAAAVRGDLHEVDAHGDGDGPHQVGHEGQCALEHAHQRDLPLGVVGRDAGAQLGHLGLQRGFVDEDLGDVLLQC